MSRDFSGERSGYGETAQGMSPEGESPRGRIPPRRAWGFEWKTRARFFGIPLICVAFGRNEHGKLRVAKGFIAVGQFAIGAFTFAQFGIGILFGLGQFIFGPLVVGQFAIGLLAGVGQFASGIFAVGQLGLGIYVLAQIGWGSYLWTSQRIDMEAVSMFYTIKMIAQGECFSPGQLIDSGTNYIRNWLDNHGK